MTVGSNWQGFWRPAVSDQVRFLIVDGAEVGQTTYLLVVIVHMVSPVIALCLVGVQEWLGWGSGRNADAASYALLER